MANLRNVRVDTETGETKYFFPMELTKETERDYRELIRREHYEVGMAKLGNREFKAVFIPVSRDQYYDLIKDELNDQALTRRNGRCVISNGHGKTKSCPRTTLNPAYVPDGPEHKYINNSCENCDYYQSYDCKLSRQILFSDLAGVDETGEEVGFEPVASAGYYGADGYEELRQKFLDYVKAEKPRCLPLAEKLTLEFSQKEAADKLHKPATTVNSQTKILRKLVMSFLENIDSLY